MPATPSRPTNDELPGMPARRERDAADPVFEMAPGVQHQPGLTASASAISEDFGAQLHDAQERLLDLRQQQDLLERRRDELEELRQKQERFLKGRVDVVERLNKGLTRLDRDTFQTRKRIEMLDHAKENFSRHLDTIEAFNPEHWSRADLRSELVRATAALEDAEQDYAEAMGRLGMGGLGPSGVEEAGGTGDGPMGGYGWPGFRYWLVAGLAFTLPLVVLGLLALALGLLR